MRTHINPIFDRIGSGLKERLEPTTTEPLPQRWVELIYFLEEREAAAQEEMKSALRRAKRAAG